MDTYDPNARMLRVPEILRRTTLSRSCLYGLTERGVFPPLVHISDRARGLPQNALDAWLQSRIDARSEMARLRDRVRLPPWTIGMRTGEHRSRIQMLHFRDVLDLVGLRSSQIYRLIEANRFPAPVPLTEGARRWPPLSTTSWPKPTSG